MASFSYTVDTSPMANAIHGVSGHVEGTTIAVVGMQAAVIAAESQAADDICNNVNRGFHALILSQLSQKSAKAKSTMDAKLLEMSYLGASLRRVREQFQADFNRIASRYNRYFHNLNEALRARVYELDEMSVKLSVKEMGAIRGRNLTVGSKVPLLQLETIPAMQMLANGQVKLDSAAAVGSMGTVVERTAELKRATREIIEAKSVTKREVLRMPVAIMESDDLNLADTVYKIFSPDPGYGFVKGESLTAANTRVQEMKKDLVWRAGDAELRDVLRSKFQLLMDGGSFSAREQSLCIGLFDRSDWQTTGDPRP